MPEINVKWKHFNVILHWKSKAEILYGFDKTYYDYYSFSVDLSEQYDNSFSKNHDV